MKKFIPIFLLLFLIVPLVAMAQADIQTSVCLALNLIKILIASIGFGLAVIILIVGGIQYMISGGDEEKAKKAKKWIINALIGIAIILAAVFIIALVQSFLIGSGLQNPLTDPCGGTI